jgi:hypothetical protein
VPGRYTVTFMDHGRERSTVGIHTPVVTDSNYATVDGQMDDLLSALDGVSLGVAYKENRIMEVVYAIPVPPASPSAQREDKWLVKGYDATLLHPWSIEIPCADLSLLEENTERMDPTDAAYTALVAAIEALALSNAGNAVEVTEIVYVSRDL